MTKQEFIDWSKSKGWKQDTWGHLKIKNNPNLRLKIQKTSVRYERIVGGMWIKKGSNYYKNLSITEEGKLKGLKWIKSKMLKDVCTVING